MIVAGGRAGADGAGGTAAGSDQFDVADGVLLVPETRDSHLSGKDESGVWNKKSGEERLTAAQQNPPQQDSPAAQNVFPQHVDPFGMQNGARLVELGMQHSSVVCVSAHLVSPHFVS